MSLSLISCIVPVFNGERYLRESLDSILAQTYSPLEIIVVDDGSQDSTPEVVASYGSQILYFRQENAGPAVARNRGLELSQGEFIAFIDADDYWHQEKLMCQMSLLEARPEVGFCLTHLQNFWMPELKAEALAFRN